MRTNRPLYIGDAFVVFPSSDGGMAADIGGRIPLHLGPGRAFGSGEHETTASCLEELAGLPLKPSWRVLDLGSGTGILAIAAAKRGAREVTAVDPEADAVETTSRNARLNGVEDSITVIRGDVTAVADRRFEVILANIHGDVLIPIAGALAALLDPRGTLILSGVHYDFAYDVKMAFASRGLSLAKARALENYCTFRFVR
jgi:ribosomal protein L11 methyltransferase